MIRSISLLFMVLVLVSSAQAQQRELLPHLNISESNKTIRNIPETLNGRFIIKNHYARKLTLAGENYSLYGGARMFRRLTPSIILGGGINGSILRFTFARIGSFDLRNILSDPGRYGERISFDNLYSISAVVSIPTNFFFGGSESPNSNLELEIAYGERLPILSSISKWNLFGTNVADDHMLSEGARVTNNGTYIMLSSDFKRSPN